MTARAGIGFALALSLALAAAQQTPRSDIPVQNLSLVAFDSRGQPVTDLTAADLVINDAGKDRQVAFLRHIERRLTPGAALAPGEFSNRGERNIPHATVILLDMMNQSFSTRGVAANQLTRYLPSVEGSDYLYLYFLTLEGKLYPVRGLPGSERDAADDSTPWTKNIKPTMDAALRAVLRIRPPEMDVALRVQLTYAALEALGSRMAGVPGRKNLVWITDGVPITLGPIRSDTGDVVDFTPLLRQLSMALDRSEIAIYPVPQIMIGSSDGPPDTPGEPRRTGPGTGELSAQTLNQFAGLTGGRPDGGKDIGAAITQAMNDARTSYQIGYYAPDETWDGKFHKLRVTCKRKGVRIQAKTGYYAWPQDPGSEALQAIRAALSQSSDAAEIGLRATLAPALKVVIDAKDVTLLHESDRYTGQLSFVVAGYDASGAAHTTAIRPLDLSYSAQERDKALGQGIAYTMDVPGVQGMSSIRFVVFDNVSHSIGSVTIPVK